MYKVMEKKVKIFSNYDDNYSYEHYRNWCLDCCDMEQDEIPAENSDDYYHWVNQERQADWEDFEHYIKHSEYATNYSVVVFGTLGLWNGRKQIMPKLFDTLYEAIIKCIGSCDYASVEYDTENKEIIVNASHHDGRNTFMLKACAEEDYENYFDKADTKMKTQPILLKDWLQLAELES